MRIPETDRPDRYCECVRYFNTSGLCARVLHYMLPPGPWLPGAREFIERRLYFVMHSPKQTGETASQAAMARDVAAGGRQVAQRCAETIMRSRV
jgi:hypothetical protein